jgi:tetratricopeptide (TPR) repeat protein
MKLTRLLTACVSSALLGGLLATSTAAQARMITPMPSPRGRTAQVVGVTEVSVDYGRPGVKGRTVIGNPAIVAYDQAQPWRSGPFQEWLEYEFQDLDKDRATLVLRWETTELPLQINVATDEIVVDYLRNEYLRGYGFWMAAQFAQAATYCDQNNVNLEEPELWAARASTNTPSFANYWLQASIQEKLGKTEQARATRALAEPLANEAQRNAIGYQLLQSGEVAKAVAVFEANVEQFPKSWSAYDSLAEACVAAGATERALELYGKALEMAPDDTNKQRIQGSIRNLGG